MKMTPFRQVILSGQSGLDVLAVKRAMKKMDVKGSENLVTSGQKGLRAGKAFVDCLNRVLNHHGLPADGKYGPKAHVIIAPHFDLYGVSLYKRAGIRPAPNPPATDLSAQKAAQRLLELSQRGLYHADNPGDMRDIQAAAQGKPVWSAALGKYVYIDRRPLDLLVWLIEEKNYKIGTYAICSDHWRYDGPHGHNGGKAVDISSINHTSVGTRTSANRTQVLNVAKLIHNAPGVLRPWQQICDGYGYEHDYAISLMCIPYAGFYNYSTLIGHRDHIHVGYY